MQIDPLADFLPGINPYNFAFNNPILIGDPYGLGPFDWLKRLINGFVGDGASKQARQSQRNNNAVGMARSRGKGKGSSGSKSPAPSVTPSSAPRSSYASIDGPKIESPDLTNLFEHKSPELIEIERRPEPRDVTSPSAKTFESGDEVFFQSRSTIFNGGTANFHNPAAAKRSLVDAYVSLINAPYMKVIIQATTNLTWANHTGTIVEGSGGKTLDNLLNDRAQAVRSTLIELGVPPEKIQIGKRPLYGDLDGITQPGFKLQFE